MASTRAKTFQKQEHRFKAQRAVFQITIFNTKKPRGVSEGLCRASRASTPSSAPTERCVGRAGLGLRCGV